MKLAKICGLKTTEAAEKAVSNDANLLGMILVPNRKRTVDKEIASKITKLVREERKERKRKIQSAKELIQIIESEKYSSVEELMLRFATLIKENSPFSVGVFRNQNIEEVYQTANALELDFIQLHGSENKVEFAQHNSEDKTFVIIGRYVIPTDIPVLGSMFQSLLKDGTYVGNGLSIPLLDSEAGGEGITIDWDAVSKLQDGRFLLAGGLTSDNLRDTSGMANVIGYDVSGGVEDAVGNKDLNKIERFIKVAHSL